MTATGLQAVQSHGGLVPPGLLARIQAGELADPTGLAPASYHLAGRETVRDAASRAWSYLRGAWAAWREHDAKQPPGPGTGSARERWLLVLLRELGYGQVPPLRHGLPDGGQDYPISHAWQHIPIHLLGPGVDLDRRNPGVAGAAKAPQAMVQELLNRSDEHLWAILSNGLRLRLLRDCANLAGSAYLEFDLQAIFDGDLYPEFLLMYQLCHVSRLERPAADSAPADCWLEAWRTESIDAGVRMLDRLRSGVTQALNTLGTGFLSHPRNGALVDALRTGTLSTQHYHRALLRLVYRLLFCFVAEDRAALLHRRATASARDRYARFFSTARLRRLSRLRTGGPHGDLWQGQVLVFHALGGGGDDRLGLPALAGLFDPDPRSPIVDGLDADPLLACQLSNHDLLTAVRNLAWLRAEERTQPVDYRNLGSEELGSVYESLLELIPQVDLAEHTFTLTAVAGNERKTTGSYYTPPSLVSALLDTALDPLIDEAVDQAADVADAQRRLLALTVCDPACGSGHFLVAASRRIAGRLATLRADGDEATPIQISHALREVIGHSIYGVDSNELAAELAKVSLWLEALEPGRPLGFLDARIRVGNSLLGATPALLRSGLPDSAFKPIEGDNAAYAADARKRNKKHREGQPALYFGDLAESTADLLSNRPLTGERAAALDLADSADDVRAQERRFAAYQHSAAYETRKTYADLWCAAFVWPLRPDSPEPPTNSVLHSLRTEPFQPHTSGMLQLADHLAASYQFLHWHIEFPEIFRVPDGETEPATPHGWTGGFSCVIGNPPWERVKLQEKEFFAARHPDIANAPNAAARKQMIAGLDDSASTADQSLYAEWTAALRVSAGVSVFIRESGCYPLTATGDINTYAIFAESARTIAGPAGRMGIVVPTGIATDATTQRFFRDLVETGSPVALYDFENEEKVFPGVHNQYRFTLLTLSKRGSNRASMAFRLRQPAQIAGRAYTLTPEEILLLNPNTGTCPVFTSRRDAEITLGIYRRVPILWHDGSPEGNPWGLSFLRMLDMANDSTQFMTAEKLEPGGWTLTGNVYRRGDERMLPLYEAKMAHHYDHRFSTYAGATQEQLNKGTLPRLSAAAHADPAATAMPRYWVAESLVNEALAGDPHRDKPAWRHSWLLGWRDVARGVDERTFINAVVARAGVGHKFLLALPQHAAVGLVSNLSAFVLDYVTRQKLSGASMAYFIVRQLPVLPPGVFDRPAPWDSSVADTGAWLRSRVLELTYTAYEIAGFAADLGDDGPPFGWDAARRAVMRAELDAAYFHLYGVGRDDVDYIMDSFKVVRERDEKAHGEHRTKRVILEIYDAMQKAIDSGSPYQTPLNPPPGHGTRHPARLEAPA